MTKDGEIDRRDLSRSSQGLVESRLLDLTDLDRHPTAPDGPGARKSIECRCRGPAPRGRPRWSREFDQILY